MPAKIKNPRLQVLKKYIEAVKLVETGDYTVRQAIAKAGISQTTYYSYLDQFGDNIEGNKIFLPVRNGTTTEPKTVTSQSAPKSTAGTDLDRLLQENAALAENLKLRAELAKLMH